MFKYTKLLLDSVWWRFDEDFCICGFEGYLLFCGFPPLSPLYWNVSLALVAESYFSKDFVKIGGISSLNIS